MAYIVMTYMVMVYVAMAGVVMTYIVMAYAVIHGLCRYGLYGDGPYSHGFMQELERRSLKRIGMDACECVPVAERCRCLEPKCTLRVSFRTPCARRRTLLI